MAVARKRGPQPEGYVQLPRSVLLDTSLSDAACRLYAVLEHYAWQSGRCWPGYKRLAEDMGKGISTVYGLIRELKDAGLVAVEQEGDGRTSTICLLASRFSEAHREQNPEPHLYIHGDSPPESQRAELTPEESLERITAIRAWMKSGRKGQPPGV